MLPSDLREPAVAAGASGGPPALIPIRRSGRYAATPWSEQRLYRPFLRAAIAVALSLGFVTGAVMLVLAAAGRDLAETWLTHLQPHGVAQLFGWAGLFVVGIAMHVVPRFRGDAAVRFPWPQRAILALFLGAIVLRAAGQGLHGTAPGSVALASSGVSLLVGVLVFAFTLGEVLRGGKPSRSPLERWLWTGLGWAVVAAVLHLAITIELAVEGSAAAHIALNRAFVHVAMFGFVCHFLFGVSLRATVGFLALRPRHAHLEVAAYVAIQLGLALQLPPVVSDGSGAGRLGVVLIAIGLIAFAGALRVFEPPLAPRTAAPRTYPRWSWFLVGGFAWCLVGAAALAAEAGRALGWWSWGAFAAGAGFHTIALGFVSMTIVGFAARVLPLFEGRHLRRAWLLDAAFVTLNVSTATRLAASFEGLHFGWGPLALSGLLGVTAIGAFAFAIWPLLSNDGRARWSNAERRLDLIAVSRPPIGGREGAVEPS